MILAAPVRRLARLVIDVVELGGLDQRVDGGLRRRTRDCTRACDGSAEFR
jgi:hypothetical protein